MHRAVPPMASVAEHDIQAAEEAMRRARKAERSARRSIYYARAIRAEVDAAIR